MSAGVLRPLRDDLTLLPATPSPDGAPAWTIHDPVRNRFFRIGPEAFEALARWALGSPAAIAEAIRRETPLQTTEDDVADLGVTLAASNLVQTDDLAFLGRQADARRVSWFMWLIHNYLFIRMPLVRPDHFLESTLGLVRPFFSRIWRAVVIAMAIAGVILALRQWDAFLATFPHYATWEGAALVGLTLFATKALHELGHGYAAKRHGCRVPTMGVALMVLWPVLYTDTTDAWRLTSRRARLEIASAGINVELALAAIATLAWSFLPDGPARGAAFLVATVTWITTLLVNLSPFMRFDGYYLLSDALDIPNLQERSFALARWRLRELLFGFGFDPPERLPARLSKLLTVIAIATWIYRLVLFLGIAALVYHAFFKALGILLFAVEIGWFILRPFLNEFRIWVGLRHHLRLNLRLLATLAGLAGIVWLVAMPVTTTVSVPAVRRAADFSVVFAPTPARIRSVSTDVGDAVAAGHVLFELESPEIESRLRRITLRIELLQARIARQRAAQEGLDQVRVLEEDLAAALAESQGLSESRDQLVIGAPLTGIVRQMADGLVPGRWIGPSLPLALVAAPDTGQLVGYVAEEALDRISVGAAARFYSDDPAEPPLAARVVAIDRIAAAGLDIPALASVYGGGILVKDAASATPHRGPALVPESAVYRLILAPEGGRADTAAPERLTRGVVHVEAEARSLADRFLRTAFSVLIRETGF